MSNIIPPLLSNSPPPMLSSLDDEEDDEFGDFTVAANVSYGCDVLSLPSLSQDTTVNQSIPNHHHHEDPDINNAIGVDTNKVVDKDFQDKRKDITSDYNNIEVIALPSESGTKVKNNSEATVLCNKVCDSSKLRTNVDNKYNSTFQYLPEIPPDIVPEEINGDEDDNDEFGDVEDDFLEEDFGEFQDVNSVNSNNEKNDDEIDISLAENFSEILKINSEPHLQIPQSEGSECSSSKTPSDSKDVKFSHMNDCITKTTKKVQSIENNERDIIINEQVSENLSNLNFGSEFNQFETKEISINKEDGVNERTSLAESKTEDQNDDFCEFETVTHLEKDNSMQHLKLEDAEDDFDDFKTPSELDVQWPSNSSTVFKSANDTEDEFGDFDNATFEVPAPSISSDSAFVKSCGDDNDDDDFGDFNDYALQTQISQSGNPEDKLSQVQKLCTSMDSEVAVQQAQAIIIEMFPTLEQSALDYDEEDFTGSDKLFSQLKDVTDTCALLYQWSKSHGQHCLLRALNIDTRNILYGPRWNETMPRYAATLGFAPLEPVKSETLAQPTSSELPIASSSHTPSTETVQQNDIPSAQFDWVGSGLTNPLENSPASTMLLDLEQLVASLDIQFSSTLTPKSQNSTSPVNDLDDWEFWLKLTPKNEVEDHASKSEDIKPDEKTTTAASNKQQEITSIKPNDFELPSFVLQPEVNTVLQTHNDSGSVKSLQLNDVHTEEPTNKTDTADSEFDDFTSFQATSQTEESSNYPNWSFNSVMLRETHISNIQNDKKTEKPHIGFEEPGWLKPTILTPDLPRKVNITEQVQIEEDEFTDFQASSTDSSNVNECKTKPETSNTIAAGNDEEFTDFQSILPNQPVNSVPAIQTPLQPSPAILEPLKPVVVQSAIPTSINWPDPGITDDELMRFELNYKPHTIIDDKETSSEVIESKNNKVVTSTSLDNSKVERNEFNSSNSNNDDDDWSDFVSNQQPMTNAQLVLKTINNVQQHSSRTSTPELPLCIPQLHQIPLPRKPAPVITQQGLIQAKPSTEHLVSSSVQQKKTYPQISQQQQNNFQPSLISNQFLAQFDQGLGSRNSPQHKPQDKNIKHLMNNLQELGNQSKISTVPLSADKSDDFDDEWTDFVSSEPAPSSSIPPTTNGFYRSPPPKLNLDWNRPPQFTSWSTNITPNIITNPVSFDSFQSYTPSPQTDVLKNRTNSKRSANIMIQPKKNTVPSISAVPDLEFIAPKNRTWKK